jgi:membrane protein YqaA with SNARE-associated domain
VAIFGPLYERVMRWSRHRHAEWYLGVMSFAESSFFPIPVDVMLAPMCMASPDKWWRYALNATVFSVLGGLAGYAIGYLTFEAIEPWLRGSHYWNAYLTARDWFELYGIWTVFVAGFSPIPYKVFTIAAGVCGINFLLFVLASVISRSARFFLEAWLLRKFGSPIRTFIEKRLGLLALLFCVLLIGGFVAIKYLI